MQRLHQLIVKSIPVIGPVGIALLIHAVWIGLNAQRETAEQSTTLKPQNNERVENTVQLIRLTKLSSDYWKSQSDELALSATLPPPPPPELKEKDSIDLQEGNTTQDCPPVEARQTDNENGEMASANRSDLKTRQNSADTLSSGSDQINSPENEDSELAASPLPNRESILSIWREAMGVPIWPNGLGERDQSVELRELSLSFFEPITAEDLDGLEILAESERFRIQVIGKRVLILKDVYAE